MGNSARNQIKHFLKEVLLRTTPNPISRLIEKVRRRDLTEPLTSFELGGVLDQVPFFNTFLYRSYGELVEALRELLIESSGEVEEDVKEYLRESFHPLFKGVVYSIERPFFLLPDEGPYYSSFKGTITYIGPIKYAPKYSHHYCVFCKEPSQMHFGVPEILKKIELEEGYNCPRCMAEAILDPRASSFFPYRRAVVITQSEINNNLVEENLEVYLLNPGDKDLAIGKVISGNGVYQLVYHPRSKRLLENQLLFTCHELLQVDATITRALGETELRQFLESFLPEFNLSKHQKIALLSSFNSFKEPGEHGQRDRSHVLILAPPGVGKTSLLEALKRHSSNSVLISSELTTMAGLFGSNMGSFEPGVLVKSNGGVLLIDNLENMPMETIRGFYSFMETGVFSLSKAGKKQEFIVPTSVIATYTLGKRFDFEGDFLAQLSLPPPLVSRFDFFIFLTEKTEPEILVPNEDSFPINIFERTRETFEKVVSTSNRRVLELLSQNPDFYNLISHNVFFGGRVFSAAYRFLAFYLDLMKLPFTSQSISLGIQVFLALQEPLYLYKPKEVSSSETVLEVLYTLKTLALEGKQDITMEDIKVPSLEPHEVAIALKELVQRELVSLEKGVYKLTSE